MLLVRNTKVSAALKKRIGMLYWAIARYDSRYIFSNYNKLLGNGKLTCLKATTDAPGCAFIPELVAAYPDAKVVLNKRDVDKWYT